MIQIICGDALTELRKLPDSSVNCCVTSPPYFGLRDYGVDGQIGLETTVDEYVAKMVDVFGEVRRVLRDDGTLWLNMGDSYSAGGNQGHSRNSETFHGHSGIRGIDKPKKTPGFASKNLLGIPWRVAFALQADGWYLRSDIIWNKPNPMPESVTDRPTKAHEYIFLLAKSERYYYDAEAIKEPLAISSIERLGQDVESQFGSTRAHAGGKTNGSMKAVCFGGNKKSGGRTYSGNEWIPNDIKRNKRTVWTVATKPYAEAHFATYPPDLIVPCIKAGCPEGGTVLDPFTGSGTTLEVAARLGRNSIGIELNPDYIKLIEQRCHEWIYGMDMFEEAGNEGQGRTVQRQFPEL